jgi:hypothetical protein
MPIREHHPDIYIYAGAWVNPYTAALEAGLDPDSPCYRDAMEYFCRPRTYRSWRKPSSRAEAGRKIFVKRGPGRMTA